jgi:hypothetical protein
MVVGCSWWADNIANELCRLDALSFRRNRPPRALKTMRRGEIGGVQDQEPVVVLVAEF